MRCLCVGTFTLMVPRTRRERARGLLGRDAIALDEGLLLARCRSVHTFGMRVPIDVVLLDRDWRPIGVRAMLPGRLLLPSPRVRHVVEVAAGRGEAFSAALAGRTTRDGLGIARRART